MTFRHRVLWALAALLSLALLIAPALWNGFPLMQWDTGGYLARWYEGSLGVGRAAPYGLMLSASVSLAFWPVLLLQAALTVWLVALALRTHGLGGRPLLLLALIAALSLLTTLPWLTALLHPDIFAGPSVLALYLLLLRGEKLRGGERAGLVAVIALSAATHNATLAVLLALIAAGFVLWLIDRTRLPLMRLGQALLALTLGAVLVFGSDYIVARRIGWTPGGAAFAFGAILQDGIVKRYLDDHCPDATLRLCAYKDELPATGDEWLWDSEIFDRLGRFEGLTDEMQRIALHGLIEYPGLYLKSAAVDTALQLIQVRGGDGVLNTLWHTYGIMQDFTPQLVPEMRAARQQRGEISFAGMNALQYPIALVAMALLPAIALLAWGGKLPAALGEFAAFTLLMLLANAFVCGALSNPHDRYGARVVWLAPLIVLLALARPLARASASR